jgi:hypothetical protein
MCCLLSAVCSLLSVLCSESRGVHVPPGIKIKIKYELEILLKILLDEL